MTQGAYPIGIFSCILNGDMKGIEEICKKAYNAPINFGLKLESNESYTVYPLEYYDVYARQHFFTFDTYLLDILHVDPESSVVDTREVFTDERQMGIGETNEVYKFEQKFFNASVELLQNQKAKYDESLQLLYLTVILDDTCSFCDFIKREEIQELQWGNFYVYSNETIELTNQSLFLQNYRRYVMITLLCGGVFIIVDALYIYLYIYINRKKIVIFRNYGFDQTDVKDNIFTKTDDKILRVLLAALLILYNSIYFIKDGHWRLLGNYAVSICFCITLSISYRINKIIIGRSLKKIYDWRYI